MGSEKKFFDRDVMTNDGKIGRVLQVETLHDCYDKSPMTTLTIIFMDAETEVYKSDDVKLLPRFDCLKLAILEGISQNIIHTYKVIQPKGKSVVLVGCYLHYYINYLMSKPVYNLPKTIFIYDKDLKDDEFKFLTEVGETNAS